jgi:hypothetical protein
MSGFHPLILASDTVIRNLDIWDMPKSHVRFLLRRPEFHLLLRTSQRSNFHRRQFPCNSRYCCQKNLGIALLNNPILAQHAEKGHGIVVQEQGGLSMVQETGFYPSP